MGNVRAFDGLGAKATRTPPPTERQLTYREHGEGGVVAGCRRQVDRGGGFVKWEADENQERKRGS